MYLPDPYFRGLSKTKKAQRKKELTRRSRMSWKSPRAYEKFKTDRGAKTRRSKYVTAWKKKFPRASSLGAASKATGVPLSLLKKSYNRGMAAWRTGHRPGASQQQWAYARTYSMLTCGKTHYSTDADLVRQAKKTKRARTWFKNTCTH